MSLEELIASWKDVRSGLIAELEQIPAEQFGFQATPECRSVAGIVRHVIGAPESVMGELCRADTDFKRIPFGELIQKHAAEAHTPGDKDELIQSLRSNMESTEARFTSSEKKRSGKGAGIGRQDGVEALILVLVRRP